MQCVIESHQPSEGEREGESKRYNIIFDLIQTSFDPNQIKLEYVYEGAVVVCLR